MERRLLNERAHEQNGLAVHVIRELLVPRVDLPCLVGEVGEGKHQPLLSIADVTVEVDALHLPEVLVALLGRGRAHDRPQPLAPRPLVYLLQQVVDVRRVDAASH
jgi:hypothetical protein